MNLDPRRFPAEARAALNNPDLRPVLGRLKTGLIAGRTAAAKRYGDFESLREAGRDIRNYAVTHLDTLLETFEANVEARGGTVHWAYDAAEARQAVLNILQQAGVRMVTKGKSMVAEEIGLNPFLEAHGIVPVETDLGEYIVQLRNEPPSHIIAPAFHLSKEQVAESFRAAHKELDPNRALVGRNTLVQEARQVLRDKFETADAGITGANFLSAADGAAVLVTNEGNGDLTRLLPKTHIVVTGIEKVVADMYDAATLLRLLPRSASGQPITSYVSVMAGPRAAEDSGEKAAFHVVLVDNGRSKLIGTEAQDVLRCIRCSACINHCPIYGAIGGHAYGTTYMGPIGAALNPGMMGVAATGHQANASTFCGRCAEVCPVMIPLPKIMRHWRAKEYADGLAPKSITFGLALWAFAARHPRLYRIGTSIMARFLKRFSRSGTVRALPIMKGWFAVRDFPAPSGRTFHDQWRARR